MILESVHQVPDGYVAQLVGQAGQTARLTDSTVMGLQTSVRRLIDFDRASQQKFLEVFARLKAIDGSVNEVQQTASNAILTPVSRFNANGV